jgi:hypothetical protein
VRGVVGKWQWGQCAWRWKLRLVWQRRLFGLVSWGVVGVQVLWEQGTQAAGGAQHTWRQRWRLARRLLFGRLEWGWDGLRHKWRAVWLGRLVRRLVWRLLHMLLWGRSMRGRAGVRPWGRCTCGPGLLRERLLVNMQPAGRYGWLELEAGAGRLWRWEREALHWPTV